MSKFKCPICREPITHKPVSKQRKVDYHIKAKHPIKWLRITDARKVRI